MTATSRSVGQPRPLVALAAAAVTLTGWLAPTAVRAVEVTPDEAGSGVNAEAGSQHGTGGSGGSGGSGGQGGSGSGGGSGRRPAAAPTSYIVNVELRIDPATGERCLHIGNRPGDPNSAEAAEAEARAFDLSGRFPRCPSSAPAPSTPPGPAAFAQLFWRDHMALPSPTLHIAPGWAVTGKAAHLEIGGDRSTTRTFDALGTALTISATSATYDVDWGDGTVSKGVTTQGGPWPHGDIRHVYTRAGTYDVVVTERWTGVWQAGAEGGTVRGALSTSGRIDDFAVTEVQAVRNR